MWPFHIGILQLIMPSYYSLLHKSDLGIMSITELIHKEGPAFSFEVLPPLKGTGFENLRRTIEKLREFDPKYINITTHRSEYVTKT